MFGIPTINKIALLQHDEAVYKCFFVLHVLFVNYCRICSKSDHPDINQKPVHYLDTNFIPSL